MPVSDKDAVSLREGLVATLEGVSKDLFKAVIANDTVSVQVAGLLDREEISQHLLRLLVADAGQRTDSLMVTLAHLLIRV